ncbi:MAG: hypothetical protein RLZZ573_1823, partial [Pseudomonadota bacterium]
MAKMTSSSIDFAALQGKVLSQFKDLDPKDPSMWPVVPRYALFVAASVA